MLRYGLVLKEGTTAILSKSETSMEKLMSTKCAILSVALISFHVYASEDSTTHRCVVEEPCPSAFCPNSILNEEDKLEFYSEGCMKWIDKIDDGTLYLTYVPEKELPTCRMSRLYPQKKPCDNY